MLNLELKIALIRGFGTQHVAAKRLKLREDRLSHIVRGYDEPNDHERKVLGKALGRDYFRKEKEPQGGEEGRPFLGRLVDQHGALYTYPTAPKKSPKESE